MTPNRDPRTVTTSSASPSPVSTTPLLSEFASDPDMTELIAMFVEEMPERVRSLDALWRAGDLDNLRRIAHQLKGAGGGYGFSVVSGAAGRLEDLLRASAGDSAARVEAVKSEVDALISLCSRVQAAG